MCSISQLSLIIVPFAMEHLSGLVFQEKLWKYLSEQYVDIRGERPFDMSEDEILYKTFLLCGITP